MTAGFLFEYLDPAGIALGDVGANGDGGGMEYRHRLNVGHCHLAGGRRDHRGDALWTALDSGAAAEHRFAGAPRRQAIDLRAYDAIEETRRPRRQFERSEQKAFRLQHDLDP